MFDCIIVGAGPAGGTAAYHLAQQGRSVLVVEKETLPRYKPCSGGVSPAIAEWFDFDFAPAISAKIDTIRYTWNSEDPVETQLTKLEPFWIVQRDVFDHFLIQQAQKQGAELRDNTEVTGIEFGCDRWIVKTSNGPIEGRYLIAADGAKGLMAKWLGFKDRKRRLASVLEVTTAPIAPPNSRIDFEFGRVKHGYIWAFPKDNGYSISSVTFQGSDPKDLQKTLSDYAAPLGIKGTSQYYDHAICLWDGNQKLHGQNALLVGDAACVADPFTAEGIRPALWSGTKAADAIHRALSGEQNALENYTKIMHEEWGSDMVWAQRLAGVFYRFPKVGYKVGVKRPAATHIMAEILCGKLRYSDVVNKALKRLSSSMIPGMG